MERKIEAKAKGDPRWGPNESQVVPGGPSILSHHKKTRVRLVKLHRSYSHFHEADLLASEGPAEDGEDNYPQTWPFRQLGHFGNLGISPT